MQNSFCCAELKWHFPGCSTVIAEARDFGVNEIVSEHPESYLVHMNERIVIDPKVCHGKPVVRGTRLPVSIVVGSLAGGMTFEDVQREYGISLEDIRAALKFAGELVEQEQHHPLPA